jgi:sugar phosphate isomerase/epimerase
MKVAVAPDVHLTYCTNIHPGETWTELRALLLEHVSAVKRRVSPDQPFGVGLRVSARAAEELEQQTAREDLQHILAENDLYVFTVNGFPYGSFHETRVKESVYRPDWLETPRSTYTESLARLLSALLPDGVDGSVSTVPVAYAQRMSGVSDEERAADALVSHAAFLRKLYDVTGRTIGLALEPEPECRLETGEDAAAFFEGSVLRRDRIARYAMLTGLTGAQAEESLRRHLGVCLDTCHAAVEFEDVDRTIDRLDAAGIRILKVQLSAGLEVRPATREKLSALAAFADDVYLHQVVIRERSATSRFVDLPEALQAARFADDAEWRIHFHVPLFLADLGPFRGTQDVVEHILDRQRTRVITSHLEVETYTWDVLPEAYRNCDVVEAIAREIAWVRARLDA